MKHLLMLALAATLLMGCKESFPEPWDKFGFVRDDLVSAFKDEHSMTALYSKDTEQKVLVDDWNKQLEAKGYKQFCETVFDDKSVARGYKGDERYLFTAGKLGDVSWELHLMEIPKRIEDDDVCKKPDTK